MDREWTVAIDATPQDVWRYVGALERHADWSPTDYTVEWLSGPPNAVGSTFRSTGVLPPKRVNVMEGSVTASEAPSRLQITSSDGSGPWTNTFTLIPEGGRTIVRRRMDPPPASGFGKVAMLVVWPTVVRPGVQKGLNKLKSVVESAKT